MIRLLFILLLLVGCGRSKERVIIKGNDYEIVVNCYDRYGRIRYQGLTYGPITYDSWKDYYHFYDEWRDRQVKVKGPCEF